MAIGFTRPDPLALSVRIGLETGRIKFMVACRSGLISPTFFVQQLNTASAVLPGRILVNIVCGHTPHELRYYGDFLPHDERYARTSEFLTICRALWCREFPYTFRGKYFQIENAHIHTPFVGGPAGPEIFAGGNSAEAADLAIRHASCLWRFPDAPDKLEGQAGPVLHLGTEVGLLVSLIARPTRREALDAASALTANFGKETSAVHAQFVSRVDSEGFQSVYARAAGNSSQWITKCLWTGAVPYLGAPAIALVGSFDEIADAIVAYKKAGISQFLFMGWPDCEEMTYFSQGVLPLVRHREQHRTAAAGVGPTRV